MIMKCLVIFGGFLVTCYCAPNREFIRGILPWSDHDQPSGDNGSLRMRRNWHTSARNDFRNELRTPQSKELTTPYEHRPLSEENRAPFHLDYKSPPPRKSVNSDLFDLREKRSVNDESDSIKEEHPGRIQNWDISYNRDVNLQNKEPYFLSPVNEVVSQTRQSKFGNFELKNTKSNLEIHKAEVNELLGTDISAFQSEIDERLARDSYYDDTSNNNHDSKYYSNHAGPPPPPPHDHRLPPHDYRPPRDHRPPHDRRSAHNYDPQHHRPPPPNDEWKPPPPQPPPQYEWHPPPPPPDDEWHKPPPPQRPHHSRLSYYDKRSFSDHDSYYHRPPPPPPPPPPHETRSLPYKDDRQTRQSSYYGGPPHHRDSNPYRGGPPHPPPYHDGLPPRCSDSPPHHDGPPPRDSIPKFGIPPPRRGCPPPDHAIPPSVNYYEPPPRQLDHNNGSNLEDQNYYNKPQQRGPIGHSRSSLRNDDYDKILSSDYNRPSPRLHGERSEQSHENRSPDGKKLVNSRFQSQQQSSEKIINSQDNPSKSDNHFGSVASSQDRDNQYLIDVRFADDAPTILPTTTQKVITSTPRPLSQFLYQAAAVIPES